MVLGISQRAEFPGVPEGPRARSARRLPLRPQGSPSLASEWDGDELELLPSNQCDRRGDFSILRQLIAERPATKVIGATVQRDDRNPTGRHGERSTDGEHHAIGVGAD